MQLYSIGRAQPRDAVRPKAKREVRWEDESSKPVDTGASTRNHPTIRVMNHKDYKTWKVRNGSIYDYSRITGFFELLLVFWKDAFKPNNVCAGNNTIQASYALKKTSIPCSGMKLAWIINMTALFT